MLTLQDAMPRESDFNLAPFTDIDGLSLHGAVRYEADDRRAVEQLCRYITRPALANERVQTNATGQVVLKLKTPWRDGTTHLAMSTLEFMQQLAATLPQPRPCPPMTASRLPISVIGWPVWVVKGCSIRHPNADVRQ